MTKGAEPAPRQEEKKAYRRLQTQDLLRQTMTLHMLEAKQAEQAGRLAWVTSGFPVEIPVAMNVYPAYPEQYGAIVGADKVGPLVSSFAEELGYSQELCSYARCNIGSVHRPDQAPLSGLPRPQALLACNNICGTVLRWYEAISQMTGAPVYLFDTPPLQGDQPSHHLAYVRQGLEDLIDFLAKTFNERMSEERMRAVGDYANQATNLWMRALEACKKRPSPLNCADRFIAMAPIVSLRGTPKAVEFYTAFLQEVQARVAQGLGAIQDERIRLLWDNIPFWFQIYSFFNGLAARGVVFPADSYTHAWYGRLLGGDLLDTAARVYSNVYLNKGLSAKVDTICRLIKEYDLDGFVLFSVRSCKRYSLGQMVTKEQVTERTGVPGVIIEGDMTDSRLFNEAQVQTRMDAFLEMLT